MSSCMRPDQSLLKILNPFYFSSLIFYFMYFIFFHCYILFSSTVVAFISFCFIFFTVIFFFSLLCSIFFHRCILCYSIVVFFFISLLYFFPYFILALYIFLRLTSVKPLINSISPPFLFCALSYFFEFDNSFWQIIKRLTISFFNIWVHDYPKSEGEE